MSQNLKSMHVGFHVRGASDPGPDCGQPVTWHDSPQFSWLECACGTSSLTGAAVPYGAPVPVQQPHQAKVEQP